MGSMAAEKSACAFDATSAQIDRFAFGPRDEAFAIGATVPTHTVELPLRTFDASSKGEPGGMLVCVEQGDVRLLGPAGRWTIPVGFMVYIPAERPYRMIAPTPAKVTLIKFTCAEADWRHGGCWTVPIPALAREMITHTKRWGADRTASDGVANALYTAMGLLFAEWFDRRRALWTPFGEAPELQRAIAFARANVETVCVADAASASGLSERTLRRRFKEELGISWREFVTELKMSKAMELLREQSSVTEAAFAAGFSSLGAFTVAFEAYTGMLPSLFARRNHRLQLMT